MKENQYKHFSHLNTEQMHNLLQCMVVCRACANQCIQEGNKTTASICHECSDVCDIAIKSTCSHAEFLHKLIDLCSQICKKCASECSKSQMPHCKECADVCHRCSQSCAHSTASH